MFITIPYSYMHLTNPVFYLEQHKFNNSFDYAGNKVSFKLTMTQQLVHKTFKFTLISNWLTKWRVKPTES